MVNGINCQNYQLLIGRKEMVVLRRAQSKTFTVILSLPRPVILSSSKDDPNERLRVSNPVPLRQAQSDSEAQRDIFTVILSSSKDDLIERLRLGDPVPLRQAQSDGKSKDDTPRRLKVGDPVPLRRAQSDSVVQSNSGAQSDSNSKDDPKSKDKKGVLCRKNIAIVV